MVAGTQIGAYRVLHQIGEGGMGSVWLAEHAMLGRRAAIKVLHPEFSSRTEIVTRFFNEARAATTVADPGIVQIFDFGHHTDGSAYIVMELLDGEPLDQRLARCGVLPVADALRIMRQVASTLGAAHARGIVHRDLKPENIFLVRDPEVAGGERAKILDFGIAKLVGDASLKTQTSAVMGTPTYMSPEQCRGAGRVDQRSDVYSLGCVLFTLLVGRPPFDAEGIGDIIAMHLREPAPVPSSRALGIPAEVDRVVLTCLAKNPSDRFASAAEVASAIAGLIGSAPQIAARPAPQTGPHAAASMPTTTLSSAIGSTTTPATTRRSSMPVFAGIAAVAVVGGAIAMWATLSSDDERPSTPASVEQAPPTNAPPPASAVAAPAAPEKPAPRAELATRMKAVLQKFVEWSRDHAGAPCPDLATLGIAATDLRLTCSDQPGDQIVGVISTDGIASWQLDRDVTDVVRGPRWTLASPPAPVAKAAPPPHHKKSSTAAKPSTPVAKPKSDPAIQLDETGIPISR